MTGNEFKYDVAFSFHSLDQDLAVGLNDLLQDRFNTFIYMQRQEDVLAGADGEERFNAVFGKDARCVVVFSRREWGETPFTRIEQTAIRNRAFDKGFDFSLFIPTDDARTVPDWLPRTRLWLGLNERGLNGAAAVVERIIGELGGEPRIESIGDRAARFQRAADFQERQRSFHNSDEGVAAAGTALQNLLVGLQHHVTEIASSNPALSSLSVQNHNGVFLVHGAGGCMTIDWLRKWRNTLDGSLLRVGIFDGPPKLPGLNVWEDPKNLASRTYEYQMVTWNHHGFVERSQTRPLPLSNDLAEELLKFYLDTAEKNRKR